MAHVSIPANGTKSRRVRAMDTDDIPAVRTLFQQVFRPQSKSCNENFDQFFQKFFFENPYYDPAIGSVVHEDDHGGIDSALSVLPIPYRVNGRTIMGRLLCAFMMKPDMSPRGAAELTLTLRPSDKILNFSDSAAPVSLRHFEAIGGVTLSTHGLGWTRVFQAASYVASYLAERRPILDGWATSSVGKMLNPLFPLPPIKKAAKSRANVKEIALEEAVSLVPGLLESYSAHPVWTESDINWLFQMALDNQAAGTLHLCAINDHTGSPSGFFCYYSRPNGMAEVLNVIAQAGTEKHAVDAMLLHVQEEGHIAAQGRVDPRYLNALSQQSIMFFRLKANVCVVTASADMLNAVHRNDIFIGGLAGESWSRLSTDFY
ncbi:hypothetical protein WH297_01620 [Ochrobactrum vermis]|uniref:GNAT family N-acetyltransferase n=1 Tax=Ochrobactrum vermis TaxID=1827297 RepID=A0ABU8P858_9HYPH|nr:hypothetical protein [Ochrobactrum vermis]PQZ29022.1 hypothetical protein CQZ93_01650 [Ochrobactrum vermis]